MEWTQVWLLVAVYSVVSFLEVFLLLIKTFTHIFISLVFHLFIAESLFIFLYWNFHFLSKSAFINSFDELPNCMQFSIFPTTPFSQENWSFSDFHYTKFYFYYLYPYWRFFLDFFWISWLFEFVFSRNAFWRFWWWWWRRRGWRGRFLKLKSYFLLL